ncbi:MAG: hypothetical protein ACJ8J0_26225 [Longimicrobiaceae bacterium]
MSSTAHNLYSSYREALLEHLFAGELMRHLWREGLVRIEMLKPQVDDGGYDLVLEANGHTRHIQLKASHHGASTDAVGINLRLAERPSGCVVWIWFDPDTLELGHFYWFGGAPGEPLPEIAGFKVQRQARANAKGEKKERPMIRVVPRTKFERIDDIPRLALRLFGPLREERKLSPGRD